VMYRPEHLHANPERSEPQPDYNNPKSANELDSTRSRASAYPDPTDSLREFATLARDEAHRVG
jgi:hypothetical protein